MQHIYMVRHGQTQDNAHKVVSGSRETPLSELGKEQARLAGVHAKALKIDYIVTSPLRRAEQTAHIIAKEIGYPVHDIVVIEEFKERSLGVLEGTSYAKNDRLNGNFPAVEHIHGAEKLAEFYSRVQHGLRQVLHDKKHHTVLIVCHMGVGRMLRTIATNQKPLALYDQPRLENATVYPLV